MMAHTYSSIHKLPTTGLRFFTVYGPWGRPDMALFCVAARIPEADLGWDGQKPACDSSRAPYRICNIGNNRKVQLLDHVECLERQLGKKAVRNDLPLQPGDVPDTWADCSELAEDFGHQPDTPVEAGVEQFVTWYREYYGV